MVNGPRKLERRNYLEDKKLTLLNVALKHFAEFGYERTSTNRIIQQAGISKGMLFHYFSSKKQLYATLLSTCLERIAAFMASEMPEPPTDLFERVLSNSYAKVKFYAREPETYKLLIDAFSGHVPEEVKDVIADCRQQVALHTSVRFEDIDISKLRPGIEPSLAFDLVAGVASLLGTQFVEEHRKSPGDGLDQLEGFVESMKPNLRILETGIYQPDEGGIRT